jgi:hypothetical protein
VQNAYLNAPTKERCYTIAGPEFGPDNEERSVLVVRTLYGLRSSGARWRYRLDDGYAWLRPNVKSGGDPYYEYVLV